MDDFGFDKLCQDFIATDVKKIDENMLISFHENLQSCPKSVKSINDHVELICELFSHLYECGKAPSIREEDGYYSPEEFVHVPCVALPSMKCMTQTLTVLEDNLKDSERNADKIFAKTLMLCFEHTRNDPWTNSTCVNEASLVISQIEKILQLKTIGDIFKSKDASSNIILNLMFSDIKERLSKIKWKQNPSICRVFEEVLFHVKFPLMSLYLDSVIPPSLMFVDDFELRHKVLGVKCLHHILENCGATELCWYGRADVIYQALQHQMYTREHELLSVLLPALCRILAVLEPKTLETQDIQSKKDRHTTILNRWLSDMETENLLIHRRCYVLNLTQFVKQMNAACLLHVKQLLSVIAQYLEIHDGKEETARFQAIRLLCTVIHLSWPRIPAYSEDIVKMLLRLIIDMDLDTHSPTTKEIKESLAERAVECLILLNQACSTGDVVAMVTKVSEENVGHLYKNWIFKFLKDCKES